MGVCGTIFALLSEESEKMAENAKKSARKSL